MHVSTETEHPQHIAEVGGVGLTDSTPAVVEALCRINYRGTTTDIADEAHARDRQEARRELRRLEDAGVVVSRELDVDLAGTARKPREWQVTDDALDAGVVERLRAGSDAPLDPVREREQRISELEDEVAELTGRVEALETQLADLYDHHKHDDETDGEGGWDDIDPAG